MPKSGIPKDLPKLPRLPSGALKILIWSKETGEEFERWPIDARAMLASGHYTTTNPGAPEETTASNVGVPEPGDEEPEADPAPQATAAKEASGKEHSPGVPLKATPETPAEGETAAKKPAAAKRKSQKDKEAGE
jgi:hypothetical protein